MEMVSTITTLISNVVTFAGGLLLLFGAVTLGTNLNQLAQVNGSGAVGVTVTGTAVYQLDQSGVTCLTLKGVEKWRAKLGVQPQAVVSAKKLLVFTGSEAALLTAPEQNG